MHHSFRLSPSSKGGNKVLALFKIKANVWLTVIIVVFFLLLLTGAMLRSKGAISIGRFRLASLSSEASLRGEGPPFGFSYMPRCVRFNCTPRLTPPREIHLLSDVTFVNPPSEVTLNSSHQVDLNLNLQASDSNPAHQIRFEIKWGDETNPNVPGELTAFPISTTNGLASTVVTHRYDGFEGTARILARAVDSEDNYSTNWSSINVRISKPISSPAPVNHPPTDLSIRLVGGPVRINDTANFQVIAKDAENDPLVFTVTSWGDGSAGETVNSNYYLPSGFNSVNFAHIYTQAKTYTVVVSVTDNKSNVLTASYELEVTGTDFASLPTDIEVFGPINAGVPKVFGFSNRYVYYNTVSSYLVDWGDGTTSTLSADSQNRANEYHTYSTQGAYKIQVKGFNGATYPPKLDTRLTGSLDIWVAP